MKAAMPVLVILGLLPLAAGLAVGFVWCFFRIGITGAEDIIDRASKAWRDSRGIL